MFGIQEPDFLTAEDARPPLRTDPVIHRVSYDGGDDQQDDQRRQIESVGPRCKRPQGKQQGIARKNRSDDQARFAEDDEEHQRINPRTEVVNQAVEVVIDVQDEIDKLPQIFHAWQAASGVVTMRWKAAKCTKIDLLCDRPIRVKGPGLRIDLDVRRIWCCAKCGKTVRTAVQVVAQRCGCADAPWMSLQPPVKREPFRPPVREPLPDVEAPLEQPAGTTAVAAAV